MDLLIQQPLTAWHHKQTFQHDTKLIDFTSKCCLNQFVFSFFGASQCQCAELDCHFWSHCMSSTLLLSALKKGHQIKTRCLIAPCCLKHIIDNHLTLGFSKWPKHEWGEKNICDDLWHNVPWFENDQQHAQPERLMSFFSSCRTQKNILDLIVISVAGVQGGCTHDVCIPTGMWNQQASVWKPDQWQNLT